MRTKVTEGDLVLIRIPSDWNSQSASQFETVIKRWFKSKGLSNCEAMLVPCDDQHYAIEVLSVNDVFENEVLGANNG